MLQLALEPIIADAYRQASLEGRDMYAFAGQMEHLKAAVIPETDLYRQWERLDDLIGEALWMVQDAQPLLLVRQAFYDRLKTHFAGQVLNKDASPESDWARWRAVFSEASFHWRIEAMQALSGAPAFEQRFGDLLEPYRQFIRFFNDRRWVETRAVFLDLAEDKVFPDEQRGYHYYVCGQIDLYFHYQLNQAKTLFATAEKLLQGKPLAFHGWIEYYLKSAEKDLDRAAAYAEESLKLDANHAPSLILKADVLVEKEQFVEAESLYRLARQIRPGNSTAYTRLFDLYGKPVFFEKKANDIEVLAALDAQLAPTTSYLTWTDVGGIFQQQGEPWWPKAKQYLQKAFDEYPSGITALLNLGYFYMDTGKPAEAEQHFQQVLNIAPDAREGYLALARFREAQEQWEVAMQFYTKVQAIIPSWERFMLTATGRCRRKLEQWDAAEAALLQAWALDAHDDSGAMTEIYELAQQYYKHPDNPQPDRAVELLDRAARARAGTPGIAAGMANRQGHALFYVERYAEALPFYQHAAELVPEEPVYYSNQADCYDKLFRQNHEEVHFQNALEALGKAAILAPQDSSIPKKRRQLSLVRYNPHLADLPTLYQLHVEVGNPLLDQITLDFQTLLPEMTALTDALRKRMQERYAINLPGLRYRDISEGAGVFQFRLYETPVFRDSLALSDDHPPAMAEVLEHLEAFLTRYSLDLFVNYWDVDKEVPLLPNAELVHFTRVVMALLAEQTPLPPLPQLHQMYRSLDGPRVAVAGMVEKLRLSDTLRLQLPGTQEEYRYYHLGDHEERVLHACLIGQGNTRALAIPIDFARGFLGAVVRVAEKSTGHSIALVTRQEELRPFLRSVLAGLPQVAVLKSTELPAGAGARSEEPLTIEEQDGQALLAALQQTQSPSPVSDQQAT